MIAVIPILFCTLSSDSIGHRSNESSDQGEALFPIAESLKIPAVSMLGESIILLFNACINADVHALFPSNTSS